MCCFVLNTFVIKLLNCFFKKSAGKLLDPIDEQRLRDHQLRRLRKLWLKDQVLTAREPLQPPKQPVSG